MIKLLETKIDYLMTTGVSNLTQKYLNLRFEGDARSRIDLIQSNWHINSDKLELVFYADATYSDNTQNMTVPEAKSRFGTTPSGKYLIVVDFLKVRKWLKDYDTLLESNPNRLKAYVKSLLHNADAQFYSDDPSFWYQGVFEDLDSENMSIFNFKGPQGRGIWRGIHSDSGGLQDPKIRVTKHIAQIIMFIDDYIDDIVNYTLKMND